MSFPTVKKTLFVAELSNTFYLRSPELLLEVVVGYRIGYRP